MSPARTLPADSSNPTAFSDSTIETVSLARRRLEANAADADALLVIAMWYSLLGDPATSLRFLHRLTQIRPEYPGVWRVKAQVYREVGMEEMAARCEETASQYDDG